MAETAQKDRYGDDYQTSQARLSAMDFIKLCGTRSFELNSWICSTHDFTPWPMTWIRVYRLLLGYLHPFAQSPVL
jgi:hypothetical protein